MRNAPSDPRLATVLEAVERGEMGLTQARTELNISLKELTQLLSRYDIDPPYSVEEWEQDRQFIHRATGRTTR